MGAVAAQGVQTSASFALQVAAARTLGPAGYGTFTVLLGILILMSALMAGLRDAAIVLERSDPAIRGALWVAQILSAILAAFGAGVSASLLGLTAPDNLIFALLVAVWVFEEAGRRIFMARLEFWPLVGNDIIYALSALGTLLAVRVAGADLTLGSFLAAMAVGSGVSFLSAIVQLPRHEFRRGAVSWSGLRQVAAFALWRSAHGLTRPGSMLIGRLLIAQVASAAALGRLEAARLLIAPGQVLVGAMGTYLVPVYANRMRQGSWSLRSVRRATVLIVMVTGVYALLAVAFAQPLSALFAGRSFEVGRFTVAAWSVFAIASAASVPAGAVLIAGRRARWLFAARALDACAGVVALGVLVVLFSPSVAPFGLAAGAALGAVVVWRRAAEAGASTATGCDEPFVAVPDGRHPPGTSR
jgi:O-antigen/teichoic acid export membrane protein